MLDVVREATAVRAILPGDRLGRTRRTTPSAGALHPVSVVVVRPGKRPLPFRVNPWSGNLEVLRTGNPAAMARGLDLLREMLPDGKPTYLALLGEAGLARAAYENPGSLLWRDAGALLATLHLCATSLGLGFCPLGLLGTDFAETLFPGDATVTACGVAAIGTSIEEGLPVR